MSSPKSRSARVAPLAESFAKSDLTRLALSDGEFSLELVRRLVPSVSPADEALSAVPDVVAASSVIVPENGNERTMIRADLVGVLRYVDPKPSVGMIIERERDLFVIEALGVRTPVPAGGKGLITEIFVNDGTPVEYGQPLLVIERV